jgi:hypothetical protein
LPQQSTATVSPFQTFGLAVVQQTVQAYRCILADSRLGWEIQLQYYCQPSDVLERLLSLEAALSPPP